MIIIVTVEMSSRNSNNSNAYSILTMKFYNSLIMPRIPPSLHTHTHVHILLHSDHAEGPWKHKNSENHWPISSRHPGQTHSPPHPFNHVKKGRGDGWVWRERGGGGGQGIDFYVLVNNGHSGSFCGDRSPTVLWWGHYLPARGEERRGEGRGREEIDDRKRGDWRVEERG